MEQYLRAKVYEMKIESEKDLRGAFGNAVFLVTSVLISLMSIGFSEKIKSKQGLGDKV